MRSASLAAGVAFLAAAAFWPPVALGQHDPGAAKTATDAAFAPPRPGFSQDLDKLHRLGMSSENDAYYRDFRSAGGTLSGFYNDQIGGQGMLAAGVCLTMAGAVVGVIGVSMFLDSRDGSSGCGEGEGLLCGFTEGLGEFLWGMSGMAFGGGMLAAGLPLTVVGIQRGARHVAPGTLESTPPEEVGRYRAQGPWPRKAWDKGDSSSSGAPDGGSGAHLAITPLVSSEAPGVGFTVVF